MAKLNGMNVYEWKLSDVLAATLNMFRKKPWKPCKFMKETNEVREAFF